MTLAVNAEMQPRLMQIHTTLSETGYCAMVWSGKDMGVLTQ